MSKKNGAQILLLLGLMFLGALSLLSACKKTYHLGPVAPVLSTATETRSSTPTWSVTPAATGTRTQTPTWTATLTLTCSWTQTPTTTWTVTFALTSTLTPNCGFPSQTLNLPGSRDDTLVLSYSPTPIATTEPAWLSDGVLRTAADWDAYCAYVSIDPSTNPAPVDFTTQMVIFRSHPCRQCPTITSLESLCRYPDRYEITILTAGELTGNCTMDVCDKTMFVGYVVDQASVSVVWKRDSHVTRNGTPIIPLSFTPTP